MAGAIAPGIVPCSISSDAVSASIASTSLANASMMTPLVNVILAQPRWLTSIVPPVKGVSVTADRRLPGPLSLQFLTVTVAAGALSACANSSAAKHYRGIRSGMTSVERKHFRLLALRLPMPRDGIKSTAMGGALISIKLLDEASRRPVANFAVVATSELTTAGAPLRSPTRGSAYTGSTYRWPTLHAPWNAHSFDMSQHC